MYSAYACVTTIDMRALSIIQHLYRTVATSQLDCDVLGEAQRFQTALVTIRPSRLEAQTGALTGRRRR